MLRLIQVTTAEKRHPLELVTIQRLLLALEYEPLSVSNSFVVDILILLKPTGFEKVLGAQAFKRAGVSEFKTLAVATAHTLLGLCKCRLCIDLRA